MQNNNSVESQAIIETFKKKYEELKNRYGENMAKLIMAAAIVGCVSPIPGTSILFALPFVGIAETIHWFQTNPTEHDKIKDSHEKEIKDVVKSLNDSNLLAFRQDSISID